MVSDAVVCKTGIYVLRSYPKKLPLWQKQVASKIFSDFPLLHDFIAAHGSNFQMQLLPGTEVHIRLRRENLRSILMLSRMPHLLLILGYYTVSLNDNISTETEHLIDLQSDFGTILLKDTQYTEFWCTYYVCQNTEV